MTSSTWDIDNVSSLIVPNHGPTLSFSLLLLILSKTDLRTFYNHGNWSNPLGLFSSLSESGTYILTTETLRKPLRSPLPLDKYFDLVP